MYSADSLDIIRDIELNIEQSIAVYIRLSIIAIWLLLLPPYRRMGRKCHNRKMKKIDTYVYQHTQEKWLRRSRNNDAPSLY